MTEAIRDQNHIPVMLGVSSIDSVTPTPITIDPVTGRLLVDTTGGSGYTNLTQFVSQTAWRIFYSNGSGAGTLTFEPPLRSNVSDNAVLIYSNVDFTVGLTGDIQEFTIGTENYFQYEIDLIEVL